jgi:electron transport complex protein RnfC
MVEQSGKIWEGCRIIMKILGAERLIVAIEDNKPEAIQAMEKVMAGTDLNASIAVLRTEYPQGAEKQQIFSTVGREVPSGGLPMDVGAVVENVGTVAAVCDAVTKGLPLTERVTTVTGRVIAEPGNVLNRIGTPFQSLIDFCGGFRQPPAKVIAGGPMMGFAQPGTEIATTKTTSGILSLGPEDTCSYESTPCISCGRCVEACPMKLIPSELSQLLESEDFEGAEELNVLDCIECGCCAFECPAKRPLVQHMRQGKAFVMQKRRAAQAKK